MVKLDMYTQREKSQDSSQDSLVQEINSQLKTMSPKSLRLSRSLKRCDTCKHFVYAAGRAWKNDGECTNFATPVRGDFVCDSYDNVDGLND